MTSPSSEKAPSMFIARHVAIIGAGFSGTLLALNLLRHGDVRVTLLERDPGLLARGLAYGTAGADHILNVRAENMSALPDQPHHFVEWLERERVGAAGSFATRQEYGRYLSGLLDYARRATGNRFCVLTEEAIDARTESGGGVVTLASGRAIHVDVIVLASGNLPPHDLPAFATLAGPAYARNPWSADIAADLTGADDILLLGTGLTAVDCAITLDRQGFAGRIFALSRRGLMPHRHNASSDYARIRERPPLGGAALISAVRARSRSIGWHNAVDEMRPFTSDLWRASGNAARARFLRHLRPYWDVHRHRIAPAIADRLDEMIRAGKLVVKAGKVHAATPHDDGLRLHWRPRSSNDVQSLLVRRVVNCTGPLGDLSRAQDPLLLRLSEHGLIRPDALSIGIDVDREGRAVSKAGQPDHRLFVVGPMTRGAHWEIVAVPDIRKQVWTLARYLTGAHWVEGHGL